MEINPPPPGPVDGGRLHPSPNSARHPPQAAAHPQDRTTTFPGWATGSAVGGAHRRSHRVARATRSTPEKFMTPTHHLTKRSRGDWGLGNATRTQMLPSPWVALAVVGIPWQPPKCKGEPKTVGSRPVPAGAEQGRLHARVRGFGEYGSFRSWMRVCRTVAGNGQGAPHWAAPGSKNDRARPLLTQFQRNQPLGRTRPTLQYRQNRPLMRAAPKALRSDSAGCKELLSKPPWTEDK